MFGKKKKKKKRVDISSEGILFLYCSISHLLINVSFPFDRNSPHTLSLPLLLSYCNPPNSTQLRQPYLNSNHLPSPYRNPTQTKRKSRFKQGISSSKAGIHSIEKRKEQNKIKLKIKIEKEKKGAYRSSQNYDQDQFYVNINIPINKNLTQLNPLSSPFQDLSKKTCVTAAERREVGKDGDGNRTL